MDTGFILRIALSGILALLGLLMATRMHFTLSSETLGVLLFAGAVLFAYRSVAAYYDRRDGA